ncbi:MAG: excalibur calcium-binding domain-containing protein [Ornithinimicrobium sp.]
MAGPASAQDDQNCADFDSQADAQAHYRADTSDPDGLDADDDGIACENYTSYSNGSTDFAPVGVGTENEGDTDGDDEETMVMPEGGAATGGGSTSGIEHGALLAAGGLALTIGAGGTILAARRARA